MCGDEVVDGLVGGGLDRLVGELVEQEVVAVGGVESVFVVGVPVAYPCSGGEPGALMQGRGPGASDPAGTDRGRLCGGAVGDLDRQLVVGGVEGEEFDDRGGQFGAVAVLAPGAMPGSLLPSACRRLAVWFAAARACSIASVGAHSPSLRRCARFVPRGRQASQYTPADFTVRVR